MNYLALNLPPHPVPNLLTLSLTLLTTSEILSLYSCSVLFKTLSSLSFVIGGFTLLPNPAHRPHIALVAGLGLSLIGDILLIPSRSAYITSRTTTTTTTTTTGTDESPGFRFKIGMLFFASAHVAYIISFLSGISNTGYSAIHYPLLLSTFAASIAVSWYLGLVGGHGGSSDILVSEDMKWPVRGYVGIIAGMLATVVATSRTAGGVGLGQWQRVLGAGMFVGSDICVARDVFGGGKRMRGRVIGWWLYFWGQMVLAGGVLN